MSSPEESQLKHTAAPRTRSCLSPRTKRFWIILAAIIIVLAIALGVGLGVGLNQGGGGSSEPTFPTVPASNNTNATAGTYWKPIVGTTWQIDLSNASTADTSTKYDVYDIDLFDSQNSTIQSLKAQGIKIICYFSAGSYENWRPDASSFLPSDKGSPLDGWPGEWWLNTNSTNVRNIMLARLQLAQSRGCDGVDPDNVDGYDNSNGLGLTPTDAVNYLTYLAIQAHALGLAIGLKNAAAVIPGVVDFLQWEVNEQCVEYDECDLFTPFIEAGKPIFHIEYPDSAPDISTNTFDSLCNNTSAADFSTVLKEMDLGNWIKAC